MSGNVISLSWPAGEGWRLQAQTNALSVGISNYWVSVTDSSVSSTNLTVDSTQPTVFYRLVYPQANWVGLVGVPSARGVWHSPRADGETRGTVGIRTIQAAGQGNNVSPLP